MHNIVIDFQDRIKTIVEPFPFDAKPRFETMNQNTMPETPLK